jgi:hypothetical protein
MIIEQYVHTLIPSDPHFVPDPEQVARLLDGLTALGAAPLNPEPLLHRPSGRLRSFRDPLTGETRSFPENDRLKLASNKDVAAALGDLPQYSVSLKGQGPPKLPPFPLYSGDSLFSSNYSFTIGCHLRDRLVSMSDMGHDQAAQNLAAFGQPCEAPGATAAFFRHPLSDELLEVANAGCARFWVEFEFGKWLLPRIDNALNIIEPSITQLAAESFGVPFAQGFHQY